MDVLATLEEKLGKENIKHNFMLAPYTTFKVGGPAEYYFEAHTEEELIKAIQTAAELKLEYMVIGGVSNMVMSDSGIHGLIIRNRYAERSILEDHEDYVLMKIGSGYSMTRLAKETAEEGLEGFEYHLGLPGTLGGALYMNSKWVAHQPTKYTGDTLVEAEIITRAGEVKHVGRDYFDFAYDHSSLQESGDTVIWATFKLKKADRETLIQHGKDAIEYRRRTQPFGVASSGCFFKNVNGESAGKMIDEIGLKGYSIGGAQISDKHANFIINTGNATSQDVQKLVDHVKKTIKDKHGIELEEEVVLM